MNKLPPSSDDGHKVNFRICPEVAEILDEAAAQANSSRNSYARQLLLDAIAKQHSSERQCELATLDALTREIVAQRSVLESQGITLLRLAVDLQTSGPEANRRLRWLADDVATALLLLLVHSGPLSLTEAQAVVHNKLHTEQSHDVNRTNS